MGFFALECECDEVSVSAKRCDESDSVVLGDSSNYLGGLVLGVLASGCQGNRMDLT